MSATNYRRVIGAIVIFVVLFAAMAVFRVREYSDKSIDAQVALKLVGIFLSLAVPVGALVARQMVIAHRVTLTWLAFLLTLVVSSAYAPLFQVSFTASVALVGCFLFSFWMTERFGETTAVSLVALIVGIVAVVSLVVYFVHPELGRMRAWLGSEFGENNRIRGIVGSPNGLGSMTAVALIFTFLYFKRMSSPMRTAVMLAAIPTTICLIMTQNRMSIASLLLCGLIFLGSRGNRAANFAVIGLVGVAVVALVLLDPNTFLALLSRSGDVSEITTGTGRTMIWEVVLEHIAAQPLLGYGYASATSILPLDPRLFSVAAHTHNVYLEVLFSGGLMSFSLFVAAVLMTLYEGIRHRFFEPMLILAFFLLRGLTEPSPFGGTPSFSGYAFFLAVSFIIARARQREKNSAILPQAATESLRRCHANLRGAIRTV